jgi:hypothetical protein
MAIVVASALRERSLAARLPRASAGGGGDLRRVGELRAALVGQLGGDGSLALDQQMSAESRHRARVAAILVVVGDVHCSLASIVVLSDVAMRSPPVQRQE